MPHYNHAFYVERHRRTRHSAAAVLGRVLSEYGPFNSAVDVGCGVGTWLEVAAALGIEEILGIDGPWVERQLLTIPESSFRATDLGDVATALAVHRRFDLAICLEVAEHVDPQQASILTQCLSRLADVLIFSAAIPGQGGVGHVNEQWPEYWTSRFAEHGLVLRDTIRASIWNDDAIPWWYRQNVMLFVSPEVASRVAPSGIDLGGMALVHPQRFSEQNADITGSQAVQVLLRKISRKLGLGR